MAKNSPNLYHKLLSTFLTLNLILATAITAPLTNAQGAEGATVSQQIRGKEGAISVICTNDSFSLEPVNINSSDPSFNSYWTNQKNPINYEANPITCGSGVTVRDERYDGGFMLMVSATDYTKLGEPTTIIDNDNLAIVTEQLDSSYYENTSTPTGFTDTGDTLLTNSQGDDVEVQYNLPFNFTYYGSTYTTVYVCSNGSINFTPANCTTPPGNLRDVLTETPSKIFPYYKDLTTADPAHGMWYAVDPAPTPTYVTFRWAAAPIDDPTNETKFSATLTDNGSNDTITFDYTPGLPGAPGQVLTDTGESPIIGITNGGSVPAGELSSSVYTESVFSQTSAPSNLEDIHINLQPSGFDFIEVKIPGTPAAIAPYNGSPTDDSAYANFTGTGIVNLIDGTATPITEGRIGLYTVYPSFRLEVPNSTDDGTYQSEITYDLVL